MTVSVGLHLGHDGGCAIMSDDRVLVACAEERLTRKKHANGWMYSLVYCLSAAGLALDDVDIFVFSNAGPPLPEGFDGGLSRLVRGNPKTVVVDHHVSHALGAFALSGWDCALALVADAGGNDESTESHFFVERDGIHLISKSPSRRPMAKGLGPTYEAFTNYLGFSDEESGKTMGLAAYGDPHAFNVPLFDVSSDGHITGALDRTHSWGVAEFAVRAGLDFRIPSLDSRSPLAQDIAAYVQEAFSAAVLQSFTALAQREGEYPLVMSGGAALNCTTNSAVRRQFKQFFASPIGSDVGLPLGNAVHGQLALNGVVPTVDVNGLRLGREYTDIEVSQALGRPPQLIHPGSARRGELKYSRVANPVEVAADAIAEGAVVGWCQGRAELGPRALGGRSMLAAPTPIEVRERINDTIKRREWFRPLAPSMLQSQATQFVVELADLRYMNEAPLASEAGIAAMPACVHVDGTLRAQSVADDSPDAYAELLRALLRRGIPGVLNTSLNVQEPIVETPSDAIATLLRSDIDLLVVGNYVCERYT